MTPAAPKFESAQIRMLRNLGLTDTEITGVETRALPLIAGWLVDLPPLARVREPIEDLQGKVRDLLGALHAVLNAEAGPAAEVARRVAGADYSHGVERLGERFRPQVDFDRPGVRTSAARDALDEFGKVLDRAVADLPAAQRRLIAAWQPLDAVHFEVQRLHPGHKAFRELVEICFQAAGASSDINLDGRIRKYRLEWEAGHTSVARPTPSD